MRIGRPDGFLQMHAAASRSARPAGGFAPRRVASKGVRRNHWETIVALPADRTILVRDIARPAC